jgi:Tfp pilus assembly protein PilF
MSKTLNLVDRLLARGRQFQALGRDFDAQHIFNRLAGFRELPAAVAEETQARLAELCLRRKRHQKARRHLTAALRHQPDSARYHYLMAAAVEADSKADPERAAEHYRRSLELDPEQPRCLGQYGLLAIRLGQTDEGLQCLRRAVEVAPDDPNALERLVKGLCLANRPDEARTALRIALFSHARDRRFRQLWDRFQFDQLRQEQEAARLTGPTAGPDDGPVLLPFAGAEANRSRKTGRIRRDGPSSLPAPHNDRPSWLPDRRSVQ